MARGFGFVHVTVLPETVHVHPSPSADTKLMPTGRVSISVIGTFVASVPTLVTTWKYAACAPIVKKLALVVVSCRSVEIGVGVRVGLGTPASVGVPVGTPGGSVGVAARVVHCPVFTLVVRWVVSFVALMSPS